MIGPQPFNVAALFVRADSSYKSMRGVDAWDEVRDASRYLGPWPVVAHPPCRGWGRLRHLASRSRGRLMYGHPLLVSQHAARLAPVVPQHLQVKSAVEFQNGTGPHAK